MERQSIMKTRQDRLKEMRKQFGERYDSEYKNCYLCNKPVSSLGDQLPGEDIVITQIGIGRGYQHLKCVKREIRDRIIEGIMKEFNYMEEDE
jgi:hypothetical protein